MQNIIIMKLYPVLRNIRLLLRRMGFFGRRITFCLIGFKVLVFYQNQLQMFIH